MANIGYSRGRSGRRRLPGLVILAWTSASSLMADTLTLDNGDRLTGKVIGLEAGTLVFETGYAGRLQLPWGRVRQLESEEKVSVRLSDGSLLKGRLLAAPEGKARIRVSELVETAPIPLDQVRAFNPPEDRHRVKLSGRANLGGSFVRGNTEEDNLHLDAEMVARTPTNRYSMGGEVNEASKAGTNTTSNWRGTMKYDHFLNEKAYLYASGLFEQDTQADLNLRTSLGFGGGRQFFEEKRRNLALEGGLSYVSEDYEIAPDNSFPSLRAALKYDQLLWGERLKFFHASDLLMSTEDSGDWLLKTRTGIRVPVAESLNLSTQVNLDYDNRPAAGKDTTDSALVFSVGYGF